MTWSAARPNESAHVGAGEYALDGLAGPTRNGVGQRSPGRPAVTLDCDTCTVRGLACGDCVVSLLIGPPADVELDAAEQQALDVLAAGGLIPPLRLVTDPER